MIKEGMVLMMVLFVLAGNNENDDQKMIAEDSATRRWRRERSKSFTVNRS